MIAQKMAQAANRRIRQLREEKLKQGLPFMINTDNLPVKQCYLEFPDGTIKIVEAGSGNTDFKIVGELDYFNAELLRRELKIPFKTFIKTS